MTMDCQTARELLEASRPRRRDWREPELRAAAEHAEACDGCETAFVERDEWDGALAAAMRDVPIPAGLKERLVEATQQAVPAPTVQRQERNSRRWLRWSAACAVALTLALGTWWGLRLTPDGLTMDQLVSQINEEFPVTGDAIELSARTPFDGSFDGGVADPLWRDLVAATPVGLDLDNAPGHEAAAYPFRAGRVQGVLIVLPRSALASPPAESAPVRANFRYVPRPLAAWTVGEKVYVCVLEQGTLESLSRQVYGGTV